MKLLVSGGGAGGASAAARARRLSEDAHIVLFKREPDVSFANCGLPNYIGGEIDEGDKLLGTSKEGLPAVRGKPTSWVGWRRPLRVCLRRRLGSGIPSFDHTLPSRAAYNQL
jgi:hypothetical protein